MPTGVDNRNWPPRLTAIVDLFSTPACYDTRCRGRVGRRRALDNGLAGVAGATPCTEQRIRPSSSPTVCGETRVAPRGARALLERRPSNM